MCRAVVYILVRGVHLRADAGALKTSTALLTTSVQYFKGRQSTSTSKYHHFSP